ncbi:MAG: OB-fold nucleic acid binding domain-containing protein [Methanosphaera sp.]|uniref:OB-fold nucleic acid binding domain-containing protein n=1 Tax=Methanosphaera sp. TaxID=2666342 RepID=UPI0025F03D3C|nr:OB-fold nucleic acid binding domain-containing protein [Methanosphaera sp.]MCI5867560.1 OB-fold nucleic acid binding domain-containing protein [Methanosphaera sp.]MDD6534027.1 OB-fold nucleic acid binding domain-containing protein [Methanosphaera sp.]MDY3956163.1 OB-fold nucleic acid binding domain-containing protein [Methanosphaera sp.]
MKDEKIFKIAIITTIIGLIGLIITSGYVVAPQIKISEIDNTKIDSEVEIDAKITDIKILKSNTMIITLADETSTIKLVIFNCQDFKDMLHKNMDVTVTAKVTLYNGELELILQNMNDLKIK